MSLSKALNNWFMRKEIKCKSPKEIDIQYRGYKTRKENLLKQQSKLDTFEQAYLMSKAIDKITIKIKLMENILKLDK